MKTKNTLFSAVFTTLFLLLLGTLNSSALDYSISFSGSGASSTVGTVIVQNLTKGTTVTVSSGNTLNLSDAINAVDQLGANSETLSIYPNLMQTKSTLSFYAKQAGVTQINIFSIDARKLADLSLNLQEGKNTFLLSLSKGVYFIKVTGTGYTYSAKMVQQTNYEGKAEITFLNNMNLEATVRQKSKTAITPMPYSIGDQLLYKGISGNNATVVADVPTSSKTINFEFAECKDADGNYYPIVKIGTQTWMAENLRTTHFRDGTTAIPNVTVDADWSVLATSAWCDHGNNTSNGTTFGHLYNWYAATDVRNITPTGWHVPSDAEWTTLTTYLGGETAAGGKLKETGLTHWITPNTGATNETGFSALGGGGRDMSGAFPVSDLLYRTNWWSATQFDVNPAWYRGIPTNNIIVAKAYYNKKAGFSVRCVKD
jgi:uncharacterized protein (TIGR02145 family)